MTLKRVAVLAVLGFAACTREKILFRDRFSTPKDVANGYLGYFDETTKQTSCGNCHVDHQKRWVQTAHARAWSDLASSGKQQSTCNSCHTVTERGNAVEGVAGYDKVQDVAYHDVQCESCHGPGVNHATTPDVVAAPLARLRVKDVSDQASCAECHTGAHTPFVEEWEQSRHSEVLVAEASNASCVQCHETRGALKAWGFNVNYVERDSTAPANYFPAATCALCHDPHGSPNSAQLRFPIDVANEEQNLCVKCHMRRIEPTPASSRGAQPHAPQGGVYYGIAGYRNPTYFVYEDQQVATTHADGTANARQCAGCHVVAFSRVDPLTNTTIFSTGHTFRPIPCLVNGAPVAANTCGYTVAERSWKACSASGCHASDAVAQSVFTGGRNTLKTLVDQVWKDLDGDETIDAYPTDDGYLARIKAQQPTAFNYLDNTITPAEGAEFNARTVGEGLYSNGDKSLGVHNPFLSRALIQANIQELKATYAFLPAISSRIEQLMAEPLPGAKRTNAMTQRSALTQKQ
jgi:predicted CXXCH cytochrome family protein